MQAIKDLIFRLVHMLPGGRVLTQKYLLSKNFLSRTGWKRSVRTGMPVTEQGDPIPWFTYSSIHFLNDRIRSGMNIFEFGSGNSTHWLAAKACKVVSLEHDRYWYDRMRPLFEADQRIELIYKPLEGGAYASEIMRFKEYFDLVIVDGRDRVQCALNAVGALKPQGVLIWDDAQRQAYREGCEQLVAMGFRRLDFYGAGPISPHASCTAVFYRENNCLGI